MTKKTKSPDQLEWEANREEREQWLYRQLNEVWRESKAHEAEKPDPTPLRGWRRLFPWRIRIERLS
jgi:hypothetical protein